MTFSYSIDKGQFSIKFAAKPPESIRSMLKASGFRWAPGAGFWWRRRVEGVADFLAALDRRLNPGKPDGACWSCKNPNGFFRPQGAATPVYCNECWKRLQQPDAVDVAYEDSCREACGL
jgi:hypothetical protein